MSAAPLVRLSGVTKEYAEGGRARAVLREASAEFAAGEFAAIRGRSGCGKSTLLNLIAGLDVPGAGEVWLAGVCVNHLAPHARTLLRREQVGFVFQFFNLIPTLSALENVQLPAELCGLPRRQARERGAAALAAVGLAERAASFPDRLSGGEQQRVAVARALVMQPPLVLADEPTGNLDDDTGLQVLELLERLTRGSGKTLLVVTHSLQVASRADRELAIDHGRLVETRARAC